MATMQANQSYPQLAAPSSTAAKDVSNLLNHSFQVKVASIGTNVIVGITGSMDGTNYFEISLLNTAMTNMSITANRNTITANGIYLLQARAKVKWIRFNWVSESTGTPVLDVVYFGGN